MTRRVISLWLPRLATDRWRRRPDSTPPDRPLVLTADSSGRHLLVAVDAVAETAGLAPGMPLADARALAPDLVTRDAAPSAEAELLERLAEWCGRYTPWTATEGTDGVWLDVAGCAHLFGGERAMLDNLLARVSGFGFAARAALAATPGAAWALARFADRPLVTAPEGTRAALAPLPVAGLRLPAEAVTALHQVGLRRIGDLYPLPRAPFAARFGEEAARRLDQALGRVAEPVSPRRIVSPFRVRLAFAEPIGHADDIARGLDKLLEDLGRRLEEAGRGGRRLELSLFRADGSVRHARVGTARAARDPAHLSRLFAERLAGVDPGFGIETMTLAATETEKLAATQQGIAGSRHGSEGGDFASLLDRLGNRLGFERVLRLRPVESHLPERVQRLVPVSFDRKEAVIARSEAGTPMRPVSLLRNPEPVTPLTPEAADGTPPSLFRWRRRLHQLRHAEGPERIAPEWWHDRSGHTRDYWRIEDTEGRRLWLYRGDGATDGSGWFVQGTLA